MTPHRVNVIRLRESYGIARLQTTKGCHVFTLQKGAEAPRLFIQDEQQQI
jgi:hypothetical protein